MAGQISAGLLMCQRTAEGLRFLLGHPGGPFFARKDDGFWTIPKGLAEPDEDLLAAARREFGEETGHLPDAAHYLSLGQIVQSGGKVVHAWAFEGDWDPRLLKSNTFALEWPPRSGKLRQVPELDHAELFDLPTALQKIMKAQAPLLERALLALGG